MKNKNNNPLQVYETFYNSKQCDFIGDQCNEVGLNKRIIDTFLATGEIEIELYLKLKMKLNCIVIELYHFIIIKKKLTWKIFQDLLWKISNNKNVILSIDYEKYLRKKKKSLVNANSTKLTKKANDLKTFEKSYFSFPTLLLP